MILVNLLQYIASGMVFAGLLRLWIFSLVALGILLLIFHIFRASATARSYALAAFPSIVLCCAIHFELLVAPGQHVASASVEPLLNTSMVFTLRLISGMFTAVAFLGIALAAGWDLLVVDKPPKNRNLSHWLKQVRFEYGLSDLNAADVVEGFRRVNGRLSEYKRAHYAFLRCCLENDLSGVQCRVTSASRIPFVFRRTLQLPVQTVLGPSRALRAQIRHELGHIIGNHFWLQILAFFPLIFTPLNWPLWVSFHLFRREIEASCDDAGSRLDGRDSYVRIVDGSLRALVQAKSPSLGVAFYPSLWNWRKSRLRNGRIRHTVPRKRTLQMITCAVLIQAAVAFCFMFGRSSAQGTYYLKDDWGRTHSVPSIWVKWSDANGRWHFPRLECKCCNNLLLINDVKITKTI